MSMDQREVVDPLSSDPESYHDEILSSGPRPSQREFRSSNDFTQIGTEIDLVTSSTDIENELHEANLEEYQSA